MVRLETPRALADIEASLSSAQTILENTTAVLDPAIARSGANAPLYDSSLFYWCSTIWHRLGAASMFEPLASEPGLQIDQFTTSLAGTALLLLPYGKVAGLDRRTSTTFRRTVLRAQQHAPSLVLAAAGSVFFLDAYPNGLPRQFYLSNDGIPRLVPQDAFGSLASRLISSTAAMHSHVTTLERRISGLATILYELFKNTDEHARTWLDGELLPASLRGLHARFYSMTALRTSVDATDSPAQRYIRKLLADTDAPTLSPAKGTEGLLEVSVFDTGPGLAQRWLGRTIEEVSPSDERAAVMACFNKGRSSSSGPGRGYGLWKVLGYLRSMRGLIRVRTNRVNVYRDFAGLTDYKMEKTDDGAILPQEVLFDWRYGLSSSAYQVWPDIRGTVVSVLIPLQA